MTAKPRGKWKAGLFWKISARLFSLPFYALAYLSFCYYKTLAWVGG